MLAIILSIGAIWAFIPVVVIIILILAARGSAGGSFFDIFGISALITIARGIGGGGSGKGISRAKYGSKGNAKKAQAASKGIDKSVDNLVKKQKAQETNLLNGMSDNEIRQLLATYGLAERASTITDRTALIEFTTKNLSLSRVSSYHANVIATQTPPGSPPPLQSPVGNVRMSLGNFYSAYYGARRGKVKRATVEQMRNQLAILSTPQIYEVCKKNGLSVSQNMSREQLQRIAIMQLSPGQLNDYFKDASKGKVNSNVFRDDEGTAAAGASGSAASTSTGLTYSSKSIFGKQGAAQAPQGMSDSNFFQALGLDKRPDSYEAARSAYRAKMLQLHPDRNPDPGAAEEARRVNDAWNYVKANRSRLWGK